jgi:hypothetical protein
MGDLGGGGGGVRCGGVWRVVSGGAGRVYA